MQKLINALAVLSFLGTASIVGGGVYVYLQKDAIIEDIKEKAINAALGGVGDSLPDMMDAQLPPVTGAPVPLPSMP